MDRENIIGNTYALANSRRGIALSVLEDEFLPLRSLHDIFLERFNLKGDNFKSIIKNMLFYSLKENGKLEHIVISKKKEKDPTIGGSKMQFYHKRGEDYLTHVSALQTLLSYAVETDMILENFFADFTSKHNPVANRIQALKFIREKGETSLKSVEDETQFRKETMYQIISSLGKDGLIELPEFFYEKNNIKHYKKIIREDQDLSEVQENILEAVSMDAWSTFEDIRRKTNYDQRHTYRVLKNFSKRGLLLSYNKDQVPVRLRNKTRDYIDRVILPFEDAMEKHQIQDFDRNTFIAYIEEFYRRWKRYESS